MSFSLEQKKHIISENIKNGCCRKALLCGILVAKADLLENNCVHVSLQSDEHCDFVKKLVLEFYGRNAEVITSKKGGRSKLLAFESKSASNYISKIRDTNDLYIQKCRSCTACFLKGVFLACGNLSDPKKQYRLDLCPMGNLDLIYSLLCEYGLSPRKTLRNNETIIYFKQASSIEDFCAFCGLTPAVFSITNAEIEGEILNNTNRIVNCETNNIQKSVSASGRQVSLIIQLMENNLLSSLPEELEYTARLRVKYESLSLSQLALKFTPPISKSGLSHRLSKIAELAAVILKV